MSDILSWNHILSRIPTGPIWKSLGDDRTFCKNHRKGTTDMLWVGGKLGVWTGTEIYRCLGRSIFGTPTPHHHKDEFVHTNYRTMGNYVLWVKKNMRFVTLTPPNVIAGSAPCFSPTYIYTVYVLIMFNILPICDNILWPGANFIELLSRENCLPEIFA